MSTFASRYWAATSQGRVAALSDDLLETDDLDISAAQIADLNNTPVELIPAPGEGMMILPLYAQIFLDFNVTEWEDGAVLDFGYAGVGSGVHFSGVEAAFLYGSADASVYCLFASMAESIGIPAENAAFQLSTALAFTAGDSPIKVKVYYRILPLLG